MVNCLFNETNFFHKQNILTSECIVCIIYIKTTIASLSFCYFIIKLASNHLKTKLLPLNLPIMVKAVAFVKSSFIDSIISRLPPSKLHLFMVPFPELIQ